MGVSPFRLIPIFWCSFSFVAGAITPTAPVEAGWVPWDGSGIRAGAAGSSGGCGATRGEAPAVHQFGPQFSADGAFGCVLDEVWMDWGQLLGGDAVFSAAVCPCKFISFL